jgi:hypothetical protein
VLQDVGGEQISNAFGINASVQIVGNSDAPGDDSDVVLWSASTGTGTALQDVSGRGTNSARGINAFGQIVGFSGALSSAFGSGEAVLWSASTGTGTALQHVGQGENQALGLNDSGQIGGFAGIASTEAVLWSSTGVGTSLAAVLGSDWTDTEGTAINDQGDIVGFGSFKGSLDIGVSPPTGRRAWPRS